MHPIEHLRHVARARGVDAATLVRETAMALGAMRMDSAGLVVACRRVVERQIDCGPLWWFAASLLTAVDPDAEIRKLARAVDDDPTASRLAGALPDDATVLVVGHDDHIVDALVRRGDLRVLVVDSQHRGSEVLRALQRADVEAEAVAPEALAHAVGAVGAVLLGTTATSTSTASSTGSAICPGGSMAAAAIASHAGVPVWLVAGRGTRLPAAYVDLIADRLDGGTEVWEREHDRVPLTLITSMVTPDGMTDPARATAECALAPELLHTPVM